MFGGWRAQAKPGDESIVEYGIRVAGIHGGEDAVVWHRFSNIYKVPPPPLWIPLALVLWCFTSHHANLRSTTRNWQLSVLGFWDTHTGIYAGAMSHRRDF